MSTGLTRPVTLLPSSCCIQPSAWMHALVVCSLYANASMGHPSSSSPKSSMVEWRRTRDPGMSRTCRPSQVIEAFRGIPKDTREIDITLSFLSGMCARTRTSAESRYSFSHISRKPRSLRDGGCTQSVSSKWIAEELTTVRKYFQRRNEDRDLRERCSEHSR